MKKIINILEWTFAMSFGFLLVFIFCSIPLPLMGSMGDIIPNTCPVMYSKEWFDGSHPCTHEILWSQIALFSGSALIFSIALYLIRKYK